MRAITPAGVWESRRLPGSGAGPEPRPAADRLRGDPRRDHRGLGAGARQRPRYKLSCGRRVRLVRRRRRGGPRARAVRASTRPTAGCSTRPRPSSPHAGPTGRARCSCSGSSRRTSRSTRRCGSRSSSRATTAASPASVQRRRTTAERRGRRRRLAPRVPRRALPARHARRLRRPLRHLRDRDHLGPLRGVPRDRDGDRAAAVAEVCGAPPRRRLAELSAASPTSTPTARRPTSRSSRPARRGGEVEQWDEIKAAVSEAVIDAGGTITHHHAVGRDHRPWYDRQRPEPFAEALRAAKRAVDPAGDPQPGVLIDPGWTLKACFARPCRRSDPVALRPQEWIKNLLVFAGVLFSGSSTRAARSSTRLLTFVAFCAISSAGYLFNDLRDASTTGGTRRSATARSPAARSRPATAGGARGGARGVGASRSRFAVVAPRSPALVALYGVITAAYSLVLKRLVIIDVMTIASLFILRVVAGAVAVEAHASECLLVCTGDARPLPRLHQAPPGGDARGAAPAAGATGARPRQSRGRCSSTTRSRSSTRWSRW